MDVLSLPPSHYFHVFNLKKHYILLDLSSHSLFKANPLVWSDYRKGIWTPLLKEVFLEGRSNGFFKPYDLTNLKSSMDQRCYKSLCFMMTRQCNLSCTYCFEHQQPVATAYSSMTLQTAQQALLWLIHQSGDRKCLEIDFFGGEPLLHFTIIRDIVLYARSLETEYQKHFQFSLTTNAMLMNKEVSEFLHDQHISVIFSLDGSPTTNDLFRVDRSGQGTYHQTLKHIKEALPWLETGYYVRGTYTHQTLQFCQEVVHLYQEGIKQISFEPVASTIKDIAIEESDVDVLKNEYEKLADWIWMQSRKDPKLRFYHFQVDLEHSMCREKLCSGCGAGVEYLSVSPDGSLYPCHQFDGRKEFCLGHINEHQLNDDLRLTFQENTLLYARDECKHCWAKMLCGGGCIANHQLLQGSMNQVYTIGCEIQKIRLETALYLKYLTRMETI